MEAYRFSGLVAVGVRLVGVEALPLSRRQRLPFSLKPQLQLAANYYDVFNSAELMSRGFAHCAGGQGDHQQIKTQMFIKREQWFGGHALMGVVNGPFAGLGWADKRRKRHVKPGGDFPQRRHRRAGFLALDLPQHRF